MSGLYVHRNSPSMGGTTALAVWKSVFQKELKGHDIKSCEDDEA